MFEGMQQFLSSDVCLSCEGCCRFDKKNSDWRPKTGKIEQRIIKNRYSLLERLKLGQIITGNGYIKDKQCNGFYSCKFYNVDDKTCQIYQRRPFECRLYPFVLVLRNNKPAVCVHLTCPYVQDKKDKHEYAEYVNYLKNIFQTQRITELLKNNPHLFGTYVGHEDDLELVFNISL